MRGLVQLYEFYSLCVLGINQNMSIPSPTPLQKLAADHEISSKLRHGLWWILKQSLHSHEFSCSNDSFRLWITPLVYWMMSVHNLGFNSMLQKRCIFTFLASDPFRHMIQECHLHSYLSWTYRNMAASPGFGTLASIAASKRQVLDKYWLTGTPPSASCFL